MTKTKNVSLIALVAAGAIGLTAISPAIARNDSDGWKQRGPQAMFQKFDENGDGQITADEIAAAQAREFDAADTNGDGLLSKDEMIAAAMAKMAERMSARMDHMIERGDTDGDGQISREEASNNPRMAKMIARIDADGDGVITQDELASLNHGGWGRHGDKDGKGFGHRKGHDDDAMKPKSDE
jgi:Ca2+-binding EF-hand superfamily protein